MHACLVIRASAWKTSLSALGVLVRFVAYKHCADAHVRGVGEGNGLGCRGGGRGGGHLQLLLGDTQIYTRLYCNAL